MEYSNILNAFSANETMGNWLRSFFGSFDPTIQEIKSCVSISKSKECKNSQSLDYFQVWIISPAAARLQCRSVTPGSGSLCRVRKLKDTLVAVQQLDKKMSNLRTWLSSIEAALAKPLVYSVCHSDEIKKQLEEQQVGLFLQHHTALFYKHKDRKKKKRVDLLCDPSVILVTLVGHNIVC